MDVAELPEKERAAQAASGRPDPIYFRLLGASANGLYVTTDDSLLVVVQSTVALASGSVRYELVIEPAYRQVGAQPFAHAGDGAADTVLIPLTEGFLDSVVVVVGDAGVTYGAVHAAAYLVRSGATVPFVTADLFSGYVSTDNPKGWPHPGSSPGPEGAGRRRVVAVTDPAAGAELTTTVPAGVRWSPIALRCTLVSDATVATRRVHLRASAGASVLVDLAEPTGQAASLTRNYNAAVDGFARAGQDNELYLPLPHGLLLQAGDVVETVTTALQAGDNYSAGVLTVREWLDP